MILIYEYLINVLIAEHIFKKYSKKILNKTITILIILK